MSTSTSTSSSAAAAAPAVEDSSDEDFDTSMNFFEDEASSEDEEEGEKMDLEERIAYAKLRIEKSGYASDITTTKRKLDALIRNVFTQESIENGSYVLQVTDIALLVQLKNMKEQLINASETKEVPAFVNALDKLRQTDTFTLMNMINNKQDALQNWNFKQAYDKIISMMEKARDEAIQTATAEINTIVREEEEQVARLAELSAAGKSSSTESTVIATNAALRWQAYYKEALQKLRDEGVRDNDELEERAQALARQMFAEANQYDFGDETFYSTNVTAEMESDETQLKLEEELELQFRKQAEANLKKFEFEYSVKEEFRRRQNMVEISIAGAVIDATTQKPKILVKVLQWKKRPLTGNADLGRPKLPTQVYSFYVEQLKSELLALKSKNENIDLSTFFMNQPVTSDMIQSVQNVIDHINREEDYMLPADEVDDAMEHSTRLVISADWLETSSNNLGLELEAWVKTLAHNQRSVIIRNLLFFRVVKAITTARSAVSETIQSKLVAFEEANMKIIASPAYQEKRKAAERKRIERAQKAKEAREKARKSLLDEDEDDDSSDDEMESSSSSSSSAATAGKQQRRVVLEDSSDEDEGFVRPPVRRRREGAAASRPAKKSRKGVSVAKRGAKANAVAKATKRTRAKKNLVRAKAKQAGQVPDVSGLQF